MRTTMATILGAAALALAAAGPAAAHGVHVEQGNAPAVVVTLLQEHHGAGDHEPLAGARWEARGPGDEAPFAAGTTDRLGRCVFRPDRAGAWRVRAFTPDGHGASATVEVGEALLAAAPAAGRSGSGMTVLTGMAVLFGVFGVVSLVLQRQRRPVAS